MAEDPLLGCQLANYRIERLVGRGGMAQVYYGWDVKLERPVAVKVIDARYRSNRAYAERFVREAQAVAGWRHENITQVFYADEQEGLYYFAMEYIDGLDLSSLLAQYAAAGELIPHDDVLRIGRAVASALDYAHEKGVIHRDVKPSNVLVAGDGRVVLTDFGLALDVAQGSLGEVFGSAHYIAPEQAHRSADALPASDQYSLGVILYEMLTGVVPFDDPSPTSVAIQHILSPLPPPREINPDLSPSTAAVLGTALDKLPAERYPHCTALMDALQDALQAPAVSEAPSPPPAGPRTLSTMSVDQRVSSHLADRGGEPRLPTPPPPIATTDADADSLIGQQLDEYRIDALLGQGGMARIYRGLDVQLKRYVAIKVIDAPFRADSDYIKRFEREARAIAHLEHPSIVRLYRYGRAGDLLYIAMQYVEGEDLRGRLAAYQQQGGLIPADEAAAIVHQVCLALDYAHSKGIIHRDVKPSNVMLDPQDQAILTDFGLALLQEVGTRGEIFGSPHYVAPEQVISSAGSVPQSDLYAVGVILYEMFTGQLPFDAAEPMDVALLHMTEAARPPRDLRPEISPELEAVILKALAKKPAERYASGAALVGALERALAGGEPASALQTAVPLSLGQRKLPPIPLTLERDSFSPPAGVESPPGPAGGAALPPIPAAVSAPAGSVGDDPAPVASPTAVQGPAPRAKRRGLLGLAALFALAALLLAALFVPWQEWWGALSPGPTQSPPVLTHPPVSVRPVSPTSAAVFPPTALTTSTPQPIPVPTTGPPQSTSTAVPLVRPTRLPTAPPTLWPTRPVPASYELRLLKKDGDSLFVLNETDVVLPLSPLRLGDGPGAVQGGEWALDEIPPGGCVAVWNDKGHPEPASDCEPLGQRLERGGKKIFWDKAFNVYYAGAYLGTCFEQKQQEDCTIRLPTGGTILYMPLIWRE
ncbi:MAG: protein kinase [Chloroflexia bacterium]|nr:protein kinase [Chloroflexia bacterium]